MHRARPERTDPSNLIVFSAAASIIAATVAQHMTSRSNHLGSEALCWVWLLILASFRARPRLEIGAEDGFTLKPSENGRNRSCWVFAAAVAVASLCFSENVLACLFLENSTTKRAEWAGTRLTVTIWGSACISVLGVGTLSFWSSPGWLAMGLSIVETLALVVIYGALLPKPWPATSGTAPSADLESDMAKLAPRVVGLLVAVLMMQSVFLGFVPLGTEAILVSIPKAAAWVFLSHTARHLSWTSAAIIRLFAFYAAQSPFVQAFEAQAVLHIVCALLALAQLISLIPRAFSGRGLLWASLAIPLLPYLANIHAIHASQSRAVAFANSHRHPIEILITQAVDEFDGFLARQSKSYTAACNEYRRRYKVQPPPGFEKWYDFALSHRSPIIDDYDVMYQSLSRLWRLNGSSILQAMQEAQALPENELWTCKASAQTRSIVCNHDWRTFDRHISATLNSVLDDIKAELPDVVFLVNHLDEPRVIFPTGTKEPHHTITIESISRTETWDHLTRDCGRRANRGLPSTLSGPNFYGLPFIYNTSLSRDICRHPKHRHQHGMLQSPTTFRLIKGLVPVLSTGSLSTMGDMLFPSPAYTEAEFIYDEHDPEWSEKNNKLYWAGSTSGAAAEDTRWKTFHRQRFVSLAQSLDEQHHTYLTDSRGRATTATSSFLNSRVFDVAFAKIYQCATKACREQSMFYRLKGWADKDNALHSKLTFDLDGNAISGRWYKLVASKSAPLKQTLLREWHDDRLLPWVHFIPVSIGMEELPEMVMYLTSTEQGQKIAKQVAERGRAWFSRGLRDVDRGIYVYRLLLELARLQDPTRPALIA